MAIPKISYQDKVNRFAVINRVKQVVADDMNELKVIINSLVDIVNNSSRTASQIVNAGVTHITYSTAFNATVVTSVKMPQPQVRRVSDNAIVDFVISNVTLTGFDVEVWENGISITYTAVAAAFGIIGGEGTIQTGNGSFLKAGETVLAPGTNTITFALTADEEFDDTLYNIEGNAYDVEEEVGWTPIYSTRTVSTFQVKCSTACTLYWNLIKHT